MIACLVTHHSVVQRCMSCAECVTVARQYVRATWTARARACVCVCVCVCVCGGRAHVASNLPPYTMVFALPTGTSTITLLSVVRIFGCKQLKAAVVRELSSSRRTQSHTGPQTAGVHAYTNYDTIVEKGAAGQASVVVEREAKRQPSVTSMFQVTMAARTGYRLTELCATAVATMAATTILSIIAPVCSQGKRGQRG
jgi:hypothetical protein